LGSLSIGAAVPGGAAAAVAGAAGINLALPDIQARIAALASFAPLPPSLTADLVTANQILASIQAAITIGITPPSLSAQIAIVAGIVADLSAAVLSIDAQLSLILGFQSLLATAGVHGYTYAGRADQLGADFTTALASGFPGGAGADATNAILLATTIGATWTAMGGVFKVTP
jgi:hypothetical protein